MIIAYEAGRKVDLNQILQHELLPVPIALAEMNGDLRTASKALLAEAITENIKFLTDLPADDLKDGATLMIDSMALLAAIGKPQAAVWRQAHLKIPELPAPEPMGWGLQDGELVPVLMTLPVVPKSCIELVSCGCATRYRTMRCKCRNFKLPCTAQCKCKDDEEGCLND